MHRATVALPVLLALVACGPAPVVRDRTAPPPEADHPLPGAPVPVEYPPPVVAVPPLPPPARWEAATPPTHVLVVAHSFTGRTNMVGREIATMLGAPFLRLHGAPPHDELTLGPDKPLAPQDDPEYDAVVAALSSPDVQVAFIGSPIWGAPTPLIQSLIEKADLRGKLIVPFCTHMQQFDHAAMEEHERHILARGARVAEPLIVRLPLHFTDDEILQRLWRMLMARRDLWWNREALTAAHCVATDPRRPGVEDCTVPAGLAWVFAPVADGPTDTLYRHHPRLVHVGAFSIERSEVTVADWNAGVKAGRGHPTKVWNYACRRTTAGNDRMPMPCVGYAEAKDWCAAQGRRLPTLAEWTRAARADRSDPYPWGTRFAFDGTLGNFGESPATGRPESACPDLGGNGFVTDGFPGLSPVCSFPAGNSPFGACDLAGNLEEWVDVPGTDGTVHPALAGGAWFDCEPEAWTIDRARVLPAYMAFDGTGFRCAR